VSGGGVGVTNLWRWDSQSGLLTCGTLRAKLTRQQGRFITALVVRAGAGVSCDDLIRAVWGEDEPEWADSSLQVLVHHVRAAMATVGLPAALKTVRGRGYLWEPPTEIVVAPVVVPPGYVADLRRLLASHPDRERAEAVGWALFGV
jgi:DNA-binding winged helix-turn-helix (wHTH) protein